MGSTSLMDSCDRSPRERKPSGSPPMAVMSGTDLTNRVASGQAVPQSSTVYTVRHTPKTIVVRGGDVFQIRINGTDAGSTEGAFKLGVGETIAITYNTPPPATLVFAE
jgi:hypothetical protein